MQTSRSGSVAVGFYDPLVVFESVCLFLPQTVKQEKTWCVRAEGGELLQGLLAWVRAQWEAMFGVKLQTHLHD